MSERGRNHEALREDLPAYALGALPDAEAQVLERHLEDCESCRERLRWLAPALDLLPASVEQHRPPDRLRERLMETVRADVAPSDARAAERKPRWRFGFPALRPAVALGAAAVLAVGVGLGYGLGDEGSGGGASAVEVSDVTPLRPGNIDGTLERQGELATLRLEGMPRLRRDQVYEVWIERGGKLEPSTLFAPDADREATAAVAGGLAGADRVLVTAEPRGGSEQPTGSPLLEAQLYRATDPWQIASFPEVAEPRTVLVTGASSGIGAATVRALAAQGFETVAAARRLERCQELAAEVGGRALRLDVADPESVAALAGELDRVDVIVHSAGGALGLEPIAEADEEKWRQMWESNVAGVMRVTKALLPRLREGRDPHIVVVGSVAGVEAYEGGGGYTAVKHAVRALTQTLRLELLADAVRVTEIAPGLVETEFSLVRFGGDAERAEGVYRGLEPLSAADVAEAIAFCVTRPAHVDVDYLAIKPTAQATAKIVHRASGRD